MSKIANNGRFVWYEQLAKDPEKAIDFYTSVVGWKTQPFNEGEDEDYVMWVGEQGPLGGVMRLPDEAAKMGTPPHWMAHVQVENVDATASQIKKLGGKIYKEPTDIPSVGRFAVIGDPQGASLSIFTPSEPNDSSRFVESRGVLLERAHDQRFRCGIRLLLKNLRMENHPGRWIWDRWERIGFSESETSRWAA
jgi:predicted enzyme related to lactoylglutathione lyase